MMPTGICIAKSTTSAGFSKIYWDLLHLNQSDEWLHTRKELRRQVCSYSSSALALTARIRTPPQQDATINTDLFEAVATTNTLVDLTAKTPRTGSKLESGCASRSARSKRGSWVTQLSVQLSVWPEWISGTFQHTSHHFKLSPSSVSRIQAYEWAQHSDFVGDAVCASHPTLCDAREGIKQSHDHIGVCSALICYHIELHESISLTDPMASMCLCVQPERASRRQVGRTRR